MGWGPQLEERCTDGRWGCRFGWKSEEREPQLTRGERPPAPPASLGSRLQEDRSTITLVQTETEGRETGR